jgi:signal transduction histidine kinase
MRTNRVASTWCLEDKDTIVSVRDNGIGILPGMLPRLFEMFSQERQSGMGTQEGLGIGQSRGLPS